MILFYSDLLKEAEVKTMLHYNVNDLLYILYIRMDMFNIDTKRRINLLLSLCIYGSSHDL